MFFVREEQVGWYIQFSFDPCFVFGLGLDGGVLCFCTGSHDPAVFVVVYY